MNFYSYRDPNTLSTIEAYARGVKAISEGNFKYFIYYFWITFGNAYVYLYILKWGESQGEQVEFVQ